MSTSLDRLNDLRFADIQTFLAVKRFESITGAARSLGVTPSQVSKAVARLEDQLGVSLLSRSTKGVTVSAPGQRLAPQLEEVVKRLAALRAPGQTPTPELTIAAPSFLNGMFLPVIAGCRPNLRVRGLELPPTLVRAYAAENFFDAALTLGLERFPDAWNSTLVGDVRKALFATPAIAARLGPPPVRADDLLHIPFVGPIYSHNGQFLAADEGCPIASERTVGHETQTISVGLELAVRTGQLVFGPAIVARAYLERGALVEVEVAGWDVKEPMYVACNTDRMLARVQKEVVEVLRAELARLNEEDARSRPAPRPEP